MNDKVVSLNDYKEKKQHEADHPFKPEDDLTGKSSHDQEALDAILLIKKKIQEVIGEEAELISKHNICFQTFFLAAGKDLDKPVIESLGGITSDVKQYEDIIIHKCFFDCMKATNSSLIITKMLNLAKKEIGEVPMPIMLGHKFMESMNGIADDLQNSFESYMKREQGNGQDQGKD